MTANPTPGLTCAPSGAVPHLHDVNAIVEEIGERHGYDLASIDDIDPAEWSAILQRHDTTT